MIYRKDYPSLQGRHDLDSILSEAWVRLMKAIDKTRPRTVDAVYTLALRHVRFVFIDVIKKQRREDARRLRTREQSERSGVAEFEPATSTFDPARLALWTEFQQTIAGLSPEERDVFLLHGLGNYTQAEIARTMKVRPYKVSRLWLSACGKLGDIVGAMRDRA